MSGGKDSAIEVVSRVVAAAAPIHLMWVTKKKEKKTLIKTSQVLLRKTLLSVES